MASENIFSLPQKNITIQFLLKSIHVWKSHSKKNKWVRVLWNTVYNGDNSRLTTDHVLVHI